MADERDAAAAADAAVRGVIASLNEAAQAMAALAAAASQLNELCRALQTELAEHREARRRAQKMDACGRRMFGPG